MTRLIRCHFPSSGWVFYPETAEGRARCVSEYCAEVGYGLQAHNFACSDVRSDDAIGVVEVVVRMLAA